MAFENISMALTAIGSIATAITALLLFLQYRDSSKPLLRIEIKDREKDKEVQKVLEYGQLYSYITNLSKYTATKITASFNLKSEKREWSYCEEVSYLHGREQWKKPLRFRLLFEKGYESEDKFSQDLTDDFERIHREDGSSIVVPKEDLKLVVTVKLTFNRTLFFSRTAQDEFYLVWHSMQSMPDFDSHRIQSWNKRKGEYIRKIGYGKSK